MIRTPSLFLLIFGFTASLLAQPVPGLEREVAAPFPVAVRPELAFASANAENFLVLWAPPLALQRNYYATRIAFDGRVLDPYGVPVAVRGYPRLAPVDGGYVIVWAEFGTAYSAFLTNDLVLQNRHALGAVDASYSGDIEVHSNERGVLIAAWDRSSVIRARLLDPRGAPRSEWITLGAGAREFAELGSDPSGFALFIYKNIYDTEGLTQILYARHISNDGGLSEWVEIPTANQRLDPMRVAFDERDYLLAWGTGEGVRGVFVSPSLEPASELFTITEGPASVSRIIRRQNGLLVIFARHSDFSVWTIPVGHAPQPEIGAPVSVGEIVAANEGLGLALGPSAGAIVDLDAIRVVEEVPAFARGASTQMHAKIALGAESDLIAWMELEDNVHQILAARVSRGGTVIDAPPIRISRPGIKSIDPAVAFDGEQFLVAWAEEGPRDELGRIMSGRVVARRLDPNGEFRDAEPWTIFEGVSSSVAAAFTDDVFLVAWVSLGNRASTHGFGRDVFASRVTREALVIDGPPLLISRDRWEHLSPDIAAGNGEFLVGWQTYQWYGHHSPVSTASSVAFVARNGTVGEPRAMQALSVGNVSAPVVAWNGAEYFAAWSVNGTAYAARIPNANFFVPIGERVPGANLTDAAFVDGRWVLTSESSGDLTGVYLDRALETVAVFPITTSTDQELDAAIASDGARAVVVYTRIASEYPYDGAGRVRFRLFDRNLRRRSITLPPEPRRRSARR